MKFPHKFEWYYANFRLNQIVDALLYRDGDKVDTITKYRLTFYMDQHQRHISGIIYHARKKM